MRGFRTSIGSDYTWPGFVDALAALLMVLTFVIMAFTVGQFYLREMLVESDRSLADLRGRVDELADLLSLERDRGARMESEIAQLTRDLSAVSGERDALRVTLGETRRALASREAALEEKTEALAQSEAALEAERRSSTRRGERIDELSLQIAALREQLTRLNRVLEAAEEKNREDRVTIADLGRRLNVALAGKVQELSRYRSQFFSKLVEILSDRSDVRIVDDRFVFPSEILFASGSAQIEPAGRDRLEVLADTLLEIAPTIPNDIPWVLRIDGHTDQRPIHNQRFASNWELSTARALAVVDFLIDRGIEPHRLAAAGFSRYHPLDESSGESALQRNRRIEITLTRR